MPMLALNQIMVTGICPTDLALQQTVSRCTPVTIRYNFVVSNPILFKAIVTPACLVCLIDADPSIYLISVIPGLDPGTSWLRFTGGLQPEVQMSPDHLLKGGTRIKSGYDEKVEKNTRVTDSGWP
jgi:hypothetical protein